MSLLDYILARRGSAYSWGFVHDIESLCTKACYRVFRIIFKDEEEKWQSGRM